MQKDLALQEERRDLMMETATNPDVAATVYAVVQELMATSFEGAGCTYGSPPTDAATFPCVTVVPMDGDPVEKRYLDGSYVANHRFALLLRTKAENDQARLDARSMIDRLAASLEGADIDLGAGRQAWNVARDALPCCIAEAEGHSDWQVTLVLTYKSAA